MGVQCVKYLLPLKWIKQEEFENLREFQKHGGVTILNGIKNFIDFPSVSQIWSCLEIIVHRAISSSLDVIALFGVDQEQQGKRVQP